MTLELEQIILQILNRFLCQILLSIFVIVALLFPLWLSSRDEKRIRKEIELKGGKLISKETVIYPSSLFYGKRGKVYKVRYLDSKGIEHIATCRGSIFPGIFWVDDVLLKQSSSNIDKSSDD